MNETLKRLFDSVSGQTIYENPFTSTEIETRAARLHDFFRENHAGEQDIAFAELFDLGQQKAFEAGFYTAVRLLMK